MSGSHVLPTSKFSKKIEISQENHIFQKCKFRFYLASCCVWNVSIYVHFWHESRLHTRQQYCNVWLDDYLNEESYTPGSEKFHQELTLGQNFSEMSIELYTRSTTGRSYLFIYLWISILVRSQDLAPRTLTGIWIWD